MLKWTNKSNEPSLTIRVRYARMAAIVSRIAVAGLIAAAVLTPGIQH
jgi:hypothetical protein